VAATCKPTRAVGSLRERPLFAVKLKLTLGETIKGTIKQARVFLTSPARRKNHTRSSEDSETDRGPRGEHTRFEVRLIVSLGLTRTLAKLPVQAVLVHLLQLKMYGSVVVYKKNQCSTANAQL
jgi:hypothetical protein